ncbi:MAG: undecaprenyl-diphosphate phosphatase [Desulfovibrionaceae bacterium]|nr:undecaprenyl-diphosphate phosphatase [Desulfovibrionaceae bacterium]
MDSLLVAVVLGLVEGLTEFLPVSSTGHLIIAGRLMGFTGAKAASFEIFIQLGAILAVVVAYRERFLGLVRPAGPGGLSGSRGVWLLFLTTLPACVLGLAGHKLIKAQLFGTESVAWALFAGAAMILVVEGLRRRSKIEGLDSITPVVALGVGLFQCLALWPGFSRSAATIMGGMILGLERKTAAEYSFIAAVPVMFAATGYEMLKNFDLFGAQDLVFVALGFGVSFFAAWAAVKGFIALLARFTLRPFAYYRLGLAMLVILWT